MIFCTLHGHHKVLQFDLQVFSLWGQFKATNCTRKDPAKNLKVLLCAETKQETRESHHMCRNDSLIVWTF